MSQFLIPVAIGELLDRIVILEIKRDHISDPAKRANVEHELAALEATWSQAPAIHERAAAFRADLKRVNAELWRIEDQIRIKESRKEFDDEFVRLARSVYFTNDERARIKREVNRVFQSSIVEEKQYVDYTRPETFPTT